MRFDRLVGCVLLNYLIGVDITHVPYRADIRLPLCHLDELEWQMQVAMIIMARQAERKPETLD
jgi:hypothetical protein